MTNPVVKKAWCTLKRHFVSLASVSNLTHLFLKLSMLTQSSVVHNNRYPLHLHPSLATIQSTMSWLKIQQVNSEPAISGPTVGQLEAWEIDAGS